MNGKEVVERALSLGEAVHGSEKEKAILKLIEESLDREVKRVPVRTKVWEVKEFHVRVNGREVEASLLPYTRGYAEGVAGKDVVLLDMPSHPFEVKPLYEGLMNREDLKAVLIYDSGKLRRIAVGEGKPSAFVRERVREGDKVEVEADAYLKDAESYNLEVTVQEGESYIVLGAHVDHWLSGYHDNLFSVEILLDLLDQLKRPNLKRGLKVVFFSSEEGPRCCTGSFQHPKEDTHVMISLDALFPSRVVFSATPDLWRYSELFSLKRVEMTTPFSDHFAFVTEGHPGVVLYNDDLIPYYHSDADLPNETDEAFKREMTASLLRFVKALESVSRVELDESFFRFAESRGVKLKERRGALVPYGLVTKFRGER
ncbi:MAG: M28 family peptidase [Sulfolobaceae archaeon]|nr:M28 family peptidase [Sulfolobales archaeon]